MKSETDDGREKGVAVIVSINKHRNDAWKLPEDILDKAELQVKVSWCSRLPSFVVGALLFFVWKTDAVPPHPEASNGGENFYYGGP